MRFRLVKESPSWHSPPRIEICCGNAWARTWAWNDFIDRYLGLIYHVIRHTAYLRSHFLQPEETEDVAAEIVREISANDYALLRQFRGNSSLAPYPTVIGRRICINQLAKRSPGREPQPGANANETPEKNGPAPACKPRADWRRWRKSAQLLKKLPARERKVVQLYFIEGRTYEEISTELNIPINHIGVILARARKKLAEDAKSQR